MVTNHASYTRFERARIVGARALQISMGAPMLVEITGPLKNPVEIAMQEFQQDLIPITVKRSRPPKVGVTRELLGQPANE